MLKVGSRLKLPGDGPVTHVASKETMYFASAGPAHTPTVADKPHAAPAEGGPLLKVGELPPPPAAAPKGSEMAEAIPVKASAQGFIWPVSGKIIADFGLQSAGHKNDGIDIAVPVGTAVRAARDGEVIYVGNEIRGYGNLVLIKHDDGYVSAYAHNSKVVVKRGDAVKMGQHIADSGATGNVPEPLVHFEIRKERKPSTRKATCRGSDAALSLAFLTAHARKRINTLTLERHQRSRVLTIGVTVSENYPYTGLIPGVNGGSLRVSGTLSPGGARHGEKNSLPCTQCFSIVMAGPWSRHPWFRKLGAR